MPRDGSGVYSKPAGTTASPNTTIESAKFNAFADDLVTDANAARPVTAGGTGSSTAATARTALGAAGLADENTFTKTQIWAKGADVASANALTLGDDGNYFDITGTTAITSIVTVGVGAVVKLHFDGVLTLTHHSTDLVLPGGANITTAAGDEAELLEYATGDWRMTNYQRAAGLFPYLYVRDEQTAGTNGGSAAAATTNARTLNTVMVNEIAGASLSSSRVTLPAGTYYFQASAPVYSVIRHKLILRNFTDSDAVLATGVTMHTPSGAGGFATVRGRFTLSSTSEVRLGHYTSGAQATDGLGSAASAGSLVEVYAELEIWKLR